MSTQRETMPGPDDAYTGYCVINLDQQIAADDLPEHEFEDWKRLFEEADDRRAELVYPDGRSEVLD